MGPEMNRLIERDERTTAVENASYRLGFQILVFGVLGIATYRGYRLHQETWDLLALVILASGLASAYQYSRRALPSRWIYRGLIAAVVAAMISAVLTWLR